MHGACSPRSTFSPSTPSSLPLVSLHPSPLVLPSRHPALSLSRNSGTCLKGPANALRPRQGLRRRPLAPYRSRRPPRRGHAEYLTGPGVCGLGGRWNCVSRRPNERLRSGSGLRVGTWAQTYSLRLCASIPCLTRDDPQCPQQNVRNGVLGAADQITASRPVPTSTHTARHKPSLVAPPRLR